MRVSIRLRTHVREFSRCGGVGVDIGLRRGTLLAMDGSISDAVGAALASARQELEAAEENAAKLRKLVEALEYTLRLQSPGDLQGVSDGEWQRLSRRAAIQQVLVKAGRPMSPKEITEALAARGRNDRAHGVSATLSGLKNQQKVKSAGYGKWVPGPKAASPSPENGTGPDST